MNLSVPDTKKTEGQLNLATSEQICVHCIFSCRLLREAKD